MENPLGKAYRNLPAIAREAAASYRDAAPFSHIVFRDFFDPQYLEQVLAEFPDLEKQNSIHYADSLQRKRAGKGEAFFGPVTQEMMRFLNAEPFYVFSRFLRESRKRWWVIPISLAAANTRSRPAAS